MITMNAVPLVVSGTDVDPIGRYSCPLCKRQKTGDAVDIGWVLCPMVRDEMICLGSCLDHQAVARSSVFHSDDQPLFDKLAREMREDKKVLRWRCLRHQAEIIEDRLMSRADDPVQLLALKEKVLLALAQSTVN
jgi:hypothetical protein